MRFESSYQSLDTPQRWLRGNHHGHSNRSDGSEPPLAVVKAYEAAGYDYFALSEHDLLLPVSELQPYTHMTILPAVEVSSNEHHTLMHLGASEALPAGVLTPAQILREVEQRGGLFIFDHPNWQPRPDYAPDALLETLVGLRGMEIYCGVIRRMPGDPHAADRWDWLLSKGWRIYGHATDDQHLPEDYFAAWNMVQWPPHQAVTAAGIIAALAHGRFYATTGITIYRVGVSDDGRGIQIESDAEQVKWIMRHGTTVCEADGGDSTLSIEDLRAFEADLAHRNTPPGAAYVRAELSRGDGKRAWTQPFWIVEEAKG